MLCPCPDNKESFILYHSDHKDNKIIDVKCTSDIHNKPTLYKCKKCNLIFSEYINSNLEDAYSNVEDERYIQQIPYKKKNFELFAYSNFKKKII